MKRLIFTFFLLAAMVPTIVKAGGIVTNTNQSASFIRMPAQDATLSIEGVYFNPAGLVHLSDGFYVSVSNQYVTQNRTVESTYGEGTSFELNQKEFKGDVLAPLFPTFYAVYKKDKIAYSFGVNPIGGGGSANFEKGLPSFEQQVSILPGMLSARGIPTTQYSLTSAFDGRSLNWGLQFNGSYALTEMISISLGFRYIIANNSYKGHLKEIMINPNQPAFNREGRVYNGVNMVSAPQFFTDAATTLYTWAAGATAFVAGLQPIIDGGGGGVPLTSGTAVGLSDAQIAQIQGLIMAAGQDPTGVDIQTAQAILAAAAPGFTANGNTMTGFAGQTADKELDASQSGFGVSPIFGVNLKLAENLNVALKYEHKVDMIMTNKTVVDNTGLYRDGARTPNDMPSLLSIGVGYKPMEKLNIFGGLHMYFDKAANYGKKLGGVFVENDSIMDGNSIEIALGAEFSVTDNILVSAGWLMTKTGANDLYHSDLAHSLNTNSVGFGGKYILNDKIGINLGFMTTMYKGYTKEYAASGPFPSYTETYNRKAMVIAFGLDYKF